MKKPSKGVFYLPLMLCALLSSQAIAQDFTIGDYELAGGERVGFSLFNFTYTATLTNNRTTPQNVTATLTVNSPNTEVIDGTLDFGDVPVGEKVFSLDTFTIRHDRSFPFDPSILVWDIQAGAAVDSDPPTLTITSPSDGGFAIQSQPPIQFSFSDATGVDTTSLAFIANGNPLAVNCTFSGDGGVCTPTTALPNGAVTLEASVEDVLGNAASTTIDFTVDTSSVEVSIASPTDGLITKNAQVQVNGTVGDGVNAVKVNGVDATITDDTFSAMAPLREGVNMVVAVATKASGRTGTDSIDVTLDLIAPTVRIDTPRNGFTSVDDVITIAGQVNDIVNGATNAVVKVNGVEATVANGTFMVMDLPLVRGPNTVEAVATDAVGNIGRNSITVNFQPATGERISIASGNGQAELVRTLLPDPLVAAVKDNLGNPVAGRVVTFTVTRNSGTLRVQEADTPQRSVQVPTNGSGLASVLFTLGDTAGEGNNRVTATALGVAGEVEFCASSLAQTPDKILATNGDNQRGVVGHPLSTPLEALVIDRDGNPIQGIAVTFTVMKGSGNINGESSKVETTGTDGIARVVLTLGLDAGVNNNTVAATFTGLTGASATFVASGLTPGNPADTKFSGVVLDNAHTPIPGAVVSIEGSNASDTTDDEGMFLLENVPVGHIHLLIDPTNSPRPETFPPLAFETVTVAGQTNILGQPILLPALDTSGSKIVGGDEDVTLVMEGVAGLELTVFANSVTCPEGVTDRSPDGKQCRLTISQVHLDKVPMPPPNGTIFMPPAWTIQPAGVQFDPPARISIPNDGLPPGRVIDIFQFDHALNMFVNVGKGTVSPDALVIVSDPGFGITRTGWGGCGQPQPPQTCASSCDDGNPCTDDSCVDGSCVHTPKTTPATAANGCKACDNGTEKPPQTDAQCCGTVAFTGGFVVCCNGKKLACAGSSFNGAGKGITILRGCTIAHEKAHFPHVDCPTGADECKTTRPPFKPGQDAGQGECDASKVEVACLKNANCAGDAACQTMVDNRIVQITNYGNTNKPGCFGP